MAEAHTHKITLHLPDIHNLFNTPAVDPFAGQVLPLSGLEQIFSELRPHSLARRLHTTIRLPAERFSPDLQPATRVALQRYCQAQIHQCNLELATVRRQGLIALQIGLVFLAVCLLLASLFEAMEFLPELLQWFFVEGFVIAGWVGLWNPVELLLYEWWPIYRDRQLYEHLLHMELDITADS
jgi:hypothetical protein